MIECKMDVGVLIKSHLDRPAVFCQKQADADDADDADGIRRQTTLAIRLSHHLPNGIKWQSGLTQTDLGRCSTHRPFS